MPYVTDSNMYKLPQKQAKPMVFRRYGKLKEYSVLDKRSGNGNKSIGTTPVKNACWNIKEVDLERCSECDCQEKEDKYPVLEDDVIRQYAMLHKIAEQAAQELIQIALDEMYITGISSLPKDLEEWLLKGIID